MASSRIPGPMCRSYQGVAPSRTPGTLGWLDQADPNVVSLHGDTPGPLGLNDHALACMAGASPAFYCGPRPEPAELLLSPISPMVCKPDEPSIAFGKKVSKEFKTKVIAVAKELVVDVDYLMAAMAFETGGTFDPAVKNAAGSGATGLIQFMPSTAKGLGTTTDDLAKQTAVDQLDYVKKHFMPYKGRLNTLDDVYMAILWPAAVGKSEDHVLFDKENTKSKAYEQNKGLDSDNDGKVTKAEAAAKVRAKLQEGLKAENKG